MSSIDEDGFLSEDISNWIKKYRNEYKDIFNLALDVNRFAQSLMFKINAHNDNAQELLLALFYIRALSTYQSIIILSERGLIPESKVLCRNLIENMFSFVACAKHKEIARMYILNDAKESLKSLNKLKSSEKLMSFWASRINISEREDELISLINKRDIKHLSTEELSKKAELHDHYLTVYHVLSQTVHVKIRDIEHHLDFPNTKFIWGPNTEGIDFVLLTTIGEFIIIVKTLIDYFSIDETETLSNFENKYVQLFKKLKK